MCVCALCMVCAREHAYNLSTNVSKIRAEKKGNEHKYNCMVLMYIIWICSQRNFCSSSKLHLLLQVPVYLSILQVSNSTDWNINQWLKKRSTKLKLKRFSKLSKKLTTQISACGSLIWCKLDCSNAFYAPSLFFTWNNITLLRCYISYTLYLYLGKTETIEGPWVIEAVSVKE